VVDLSLFTKVPQESFMQCYAVPVKYTCL